MTFRRSAHPLAIALAAWLAVGLPLVAADDLARAKELYASAAYEDALTVLDGLKASPPAAEATEIAEYRVFCLLALQRMPDAQKAIEEIVTADPFYQPSEAQVSPRIRAVFHEVRQSLIPAIAQKMYVEAKAAFEKKEPGSTQKFERVLKLLDDPDVKEFPAFTDLRTVASGFRDLSKAMDAAAAKAATPAALAPAPAAPAAATPAAAAQATAPAPAQTTPASAPQAPAPAAAAPAPAGPRTITQQTAPPGTVAPVALYQPMPPWAPTRMPESRTLYAGTIEVTIDEQGNVAAVNIPKSIHPQYDGELRRTSRTWRFRPATINGMPVRYVKTIEIQLRPVQ